ncbi:hypothetical protein CJ014_00395 [Pleomorphomonas carboxyditropha]|uniref:Uncharacterized protein n=1 Tax=Pleomorphomonas carboxyditropha TaxID=2023338 RepID=A0A2G9X2L0_9HYPH|nr:hypothetical protein CJ014_00395 [Pleomorphomonas carboxyditropha]
MFTIEDWSHRIQERTKPKNSRFGEFIQSFAGFGLAGGQALSRRLSTTRFRPALSKSTVTLLPSTAATEPGQAGSSGKMFGGLHRRGLSSVEHPARVSMPRTGLFDPRGRPAPMRGFP